VLRAIGSLLPPPPPGTPGPFALSEDGRIEGACEVHGLTVVYKSRVACPMLYGNLADGAKAFLGTGPAAAAIYNSNRQAVEETIARALQPFNVTDDMYFLQNSFLVFMATK
jgi:hypothetical protein